jgi:hypothetical protein
MIVAGDVPMPDGRTLRIAHDDVERVVHIVYGSGSAREWSEDVRGDALSVPSSAVPAIIEALRRLSSL